MCTSSSLQFHGIDGSSSIQRSSELEFQAPGTTIHSDQWAVYNNSIVQQHAFSQP